MDKDEISNLLDKKEDEKKGKPDKGKKPGKGKKPDEEKEPAKGEGLVEPEVELEKGKLEEGEPSEATEAEKAETEAEAEKAEPGEAVGEPEAEEKPEAEATEAERAGIAEPHRPEPPEVDQIAAKSLIREVFPADIAEGIAASAMHPEDVREMAVSYRAAMAQPIGDPAKFAAKLAESYQTDPKRVPPPTEGRNKNGETVPFEDLSDEEKAEAYRQHQTQIVATSMAAREKLTNELMMPTLTNKPRLPKGLASNLATVMLTSPPKEELDKLREAAGRGDKDAQRAIEDYDATIASVVEGTFAGVLEAGPVPVRDSVARGLLRHLSDNPGAQKIARTFFEAGDYYEAKSKFLGEGGVTEHSSPREILSGLDKADKWFAKRAKVYGEQSHGLASTFKTRVLNKLAALQPEKYFEVREKIDQQEDKAYEAAEAKWFSAHSKWEARKREAEEAGPFGGYGVVAPGASTSFDEPEPETPKKPVRYGISKSPETLRSMGKRLFKKLFERTKTATADYVSTYLRGSTMGQPTNKTGVYHGIDPVENDPGLYPDHRPKVFGTEEFETTLAAAKGWLKDPSLGETTGDQKFRSALDLAIQGTGVDKLMSPEIYDQLLVKLAGREVQAVDSSCRPSEGSEVCPMKASREIRKMAAQAVQTDPKLAYDLSDLADRLVDDSKYTKIRSLIIRTAASDARAKKALLPILRALKAMESSNPSE
jgi:hypothetical protein